MSSRMFPESENIRVFPKDETIQIYTCFVCGGPGTTRHHFVPKHARMKMKRHDTKSKDTVRACSHCHSDIHYYFSNWELAVKFNTEATLVEELRNRRLFSLNF